VVWILGAALDFSLSPSFGMLQEAGGGYVYLFSFFLYLEWKRCFFLLLVCRKIALAIYFAHLFFSSPPFSLWSCWEKRQKESFFPFLPFAEQ